MAGWVTFANGQGFLPVFPIPVFKLHGNWRAYGHAVADAGEDVSGILFDLHPAATAIALLPAPEFAVEKTLVHSQPSGQARQKRDQSFAVGFSGSEVTQHKCSILPDAAASSKVPE
jgi:hypothetical protein